MEKNITLEIGANCIIETDQRTQIDENSLISRIEGCKQTAKELGVILEIAIYDSYPSVFSGGRVPDLEQKEVLTLFRILNENRIAFNLALNGGMNLTKEECNLDSHQEIVSLLDSLADSETEHSAIITNDYLFNEVKKRYNDRIRTIASCIKFAGYPEDEKEKKIAKCLEGYDFVCPDNPTVISMNKMAKHLKQAHKMMPLLTSRCLGSKKCQEHYVAIDGLNTKASQGADSAEEAMEIYRIFDGKTPEVCECEEAQLLHPKNIDTLRWLIRGGVSRFKIGRRSEGGNGDTLDMQIELLLAAVV